MKPGQIEQRKRWVLRDETLNPHRPRGSKHGVWLHQRGYHLGDIRCSLCNKWINPTNPEEAKEIKRTEKGIQLHHPRYCQYKGMGGVARFSTVSRHRPSEAKDRLRLHEVVRY